MGMKAQCLQSRSVAPFVNADEWITREVVVGGEGVLGQVNVCVVELNEE